MEITAELRLHVGVRNNHSILENCYFTQPLKLANITEDRKTDPLRLMITSSSPGILDNDHYRIQINLASRTMVELTTQSYQRLFLMKYGASQITCIRLLENSSLIYIPQPSVPHKGSIFRGQTDVFLEHKCRLVFGEIFTCGRKSSGEIFLFSRYHNTTRIFLQNKLMINENILIEPQKTDPLQIGQFEGFTHSATLIFLEEQIEIKSLINKITAYLDKINTIIFGITVAPLNGFILRIFGHNADQLYNCLGEINNCFIQNSGQH